MSRPVRPFPVASRSLEKYQRKYSWYNRPAGLVDFDWDLREHVTRNFSYKPLFPQKIPTYQERRLKMIRFVYESWLQNLKPWQAYRESFCFNYSHRMIKPISESDLYQILDWFF